jgi:hypothetical protein
VVLATACGRSPLDLDGLAATAATTADATSTGTTLEDGTTDAGPPSELDCEAQGGRLPQVGEPWVLQSHIPEYPPAYGVVADREGMLAMWRGPFSGTDPMPNLLGMRVGYDGSVQGMVEPVWDQPVTFEPAVHQADAEGYVVSYCGRFGSQDELTARVIDAMGVDLVASSTFGSSCGAARPEGVWTGEAYVFAWVDNVNSDLRLIGADRTLVGVWFELLEDYGNLSAPPRMAVGPNDVLMVAGAGDQVRAYPIALDGRWLSSHALPLPDGHDIGPVAVGARSDGAYTIFLADRSLPGLWVMPFRNEEAGTPSRVEGANARYSELLLLQRAGGLLLVTEANDEDGATWIEIIATDERGVPTAIERITGGERALYEARPAAVVYGGGAFVLYMAGHEEGTFDVRLVELGCAR